MNSDIKQKIVFEKRLELNKSKIELEPTKEKTNKITTNYEEKKNIINLINENDPQFLENFEILDYVNSGSVGTFYQGCLKKNKKQKIGLKFFLNRKHKEEEFENEEIKYLRKLNHKNIIKLIGYLKINDMNTCAILELAKYGDFDNFKHKILKQKYLSETFLCYFSFQLLQSLNYIHKNKILHCDIKESNILIDGNLNIKLTDFSVSSSYSKYKSDEKIIYPFVGTGKYMSPEILSREKILVKDTNKIDIYSLGVVLYYLVYNCYPYNLKTVKNDEYEGKLKKSKNNELNFSNDRKISRIFENFLRGILEIDINKRFDIKTAMNHPFIKGGLILMDEKEKVNCLEKFLVELVSDNVMEFNEYVKNEENKI